MILKKLRELFHSFREDGVYYAGWSFNRTGLGRKLGPKVQKAVDRIESYAGVMMGSAFLLMGTTIATRSAISLGIDFVPAMTEMTAAYGVLGTVATPVVYGLLATVAGGASVSMTGAGLGILTTSVARYNSGLKAPAVKAAEPEAKPEVLVPALPSMEVQNKLGNAPAPAEALKKVVDLPTITADMHTALPDIKTAKLRNPPTAP